MTRDERRKLKEKESEVITKLSIIHDKVRKCKNIDRYIVGSENHWGVVDSSGKIIIPLQFTNINMSNGKLFRVYGEVNSSLQKHQVFDALIKYQTIYDIDGKQLMPLITFTSVISAGKYGLLMGYDMFGSAGVYPEQNMYVVSYNANTATELDSSVKGLIVDERLPEIVIAAVKEGYDTEDDFKYLGIRIDKGTKLESLADCFDKIILTEYNQDILEEYIKGAGLSSSYAEELRNTCKEYDSGKEHDNWCLCKIGNKHIFTDKTYNFIQSNRRKNSVKEVWRADNL